jgi:hypothetical protein
MASRFQNKWVSALLSGAFVFSLSQSAFAVGANDPAGNPPSGQQQSLSALSAQQVADYSADPAKLLTDFASNPDGLAQAITQLATSGTSGANAATAALQMAAASGNKGLAQAIAKGLGVAVAQLTKAGNIALASSIQATVASIAAATGSQDIADAVNSSFASGQNSTATAAIPGGAGGGDGGSAGVGGGGGAGGGGVSGASNGFSSGGGGTSDTSSTNSSTGSSFSGTSSASAPTPSAS